jgi:hypothetical protein
MRWNRRDHDVQDTLLLSVAEPSVDDGIRAKVEEFASWLHAARPWKGVPPSFVYEVDSASCTQEGDLPVTCGVILLLQPHLASGSRDEDRAQLADVEYLVEQMRRFTANDGLEIEVEYNGELVGTIAEGAVDGPRRVGLLEEWRKALAD